MGHQGYTQSRRDDLQSVVNMFTYLLLGCLPWSDLADSKGEQQMELIREKKVQFFSRSRCPFVSSIWKLRFQERPDYVLLRQLVDDVQNNPSLMATKDSILLRSDPEVDCAFDDSSDSE